MVEDVKESGLMPEQENDKVVEDMVEMLMKADPSFEKLAKNILKRIYTDALFKTATGFDYWIKVSPIIVDGVFAGFDIQTSEGSIHDKGIEAEDVFKALAPTMIAFSRFKASRPTNLFEAIQRTLNEECNCPACQARRAAGEKPTQH